MYARQSPPERAAEVSEQAARCMDCGIPFCHSGTAGCPLGNLIPEWNDLVRRGRWDAASERLHATNNFPEFTGRVCPAPCESACVLAIADDAPAAASPSSGSSRPSPTSPGRRAVGPQPAATPRAAVAVVGSGPAGLAAAQQLTRAGHEVTVYERDDRLGGLLRYGIPEFKMEKAISIGGWRRCAPRAPNSSPAARSASTCTVAQLRERFDAVVLAVGALRGRDNRVAGRDLDGVHLAMEHLVPANKECEGDGPSPISATASMW